MRLVLARRAAASCCAGLLLGLLACGLAAARPGAKEHAPAAAPAETEVQSLVRRYHAAQREVLRQQLCLMTPGCLTDEGRLLDALEVGKRMSQGLADRAQAGDVLAAHERGLIALSAAGLQRARSHSEAENQNPGALVLRRRWAQEQIVAERYLGMAAMAGHPPACLALGKTLSERVPQPEPELVGRLFRCAVSGFSAQGQRRQAVEAYAQMRLALPPQDPAMVEVHAVIHGPQPPERAWRRVEPTEAEALRRGATP
ncbi:MAG: hypothetical protein QE285_17375 [Aquabacterium sp.]|nr:hypothetical protein [Aquabacterium sp.]